MAGKLRARSLAVCFRSRRTLCQSHLQQRLVSVVSAEGCRGLRVSRAWWEEDAQRGVPRLKSRLPGPLICSAWGIFFKWRKCHKQTMRAHPALWSRREQEGPPSGKYHTSLSDAQIEFYADPRLSFGKSHCRPLLELVSRKVFKPSPLIKLKGVSRPHSLYLIFFFGGGR